MSNFFHRLIFGPLKITKITTIILVTINLPKGTQLNGCDSYQNVQVRQKDFRGIWKALPLSAKFSSEEKEKINRVYFAANLYLLFNPLTVKSIILRAQKLRPNASTTSRMMPENCIGTRSRKATACAACLRHQHQNYFHQNSANYGVKGRECVN